MRYEQIFDRVTGGKTYYVRVAVANDYNYDGALDYAYSDVVSVTPMVRVMGLRVGSSSQRSLSLRLNRELVADSLPPGSAFGVTARCSGAGRTTAGTGTAAIDGDTIRVALAEAVADCERLAVRYTRPETGAALRDADGGLETPGFTAEVRTDGPEVAIVSDPGPDATYGQGDTIRVRLRYTEAVDVDTAGGTPRLKIKMDPEYGEKWADYESGGGTAALVFAYGPVMEPNHSPRGIAVLTDTLEVNGGAIVSAATGQAVALDHAGLDHDPAHKVDHADVSDAPPAVTGVAITSTPRIDSDGDGEADTYGVGEAVEATVTWDRDVAWDLSAPGARMRVRLDIGGEEKGAELVTDGAQSGTARSLAFRYEVVRSRPRRGRRAGGAVGGRQHGGALGRRDADRRGRLGRLGRGACTRGARAGPEPPGGRRPHRGRAGRRADGDGRGDHVDAADRQRRRRRGGHLRRR